MKKNSKLIVLETKRDIQPDKALVEGLEKLLEGAKNGDILSLSIAIEGRKQVTWKTIGEAVSTSDHIFCLERLKNDLLFSNNNND